MKTVFFTCIAFFVISVKILSQNAMIQFMNPFQIHIDPMERLLLVNFEKDPDSLYIGFEPQVFDDEKNGTGHLVIGWRNDGRVDVYHQPGIMPDPKKYDIAGKGLANLVETTMEEAVFEITLKGVQCIYMFRDIHQRNIILKIREANPSLRKPFGLLAPMGHAAQNPSALPLVMLHDFYFVRKKHTDILVSIDGKSHSPDKLQIPMDGKQMYFARYSPKPVIATFNPAYKGEIFPLELITGQKILQSGSQTFHFLWNDKTPSLERIVYNEALYPLELRFIDPFPHILGSKTINAIQGRFQIVGHHSVGTVAGTYSIEQTDSVTSIKLVPTEGWKPRPDKFSLRFLYTVAKMFKNWPKTYEWNAVITSSLQETTMISKWKRL
jgi:hypothetical protein